MKMKGEYEQEIAKLLANPERLLLVRPFTRGVEPESLPSKERAYVGELTRAELPTFSRMVVTQDQFLAELDPRSHEVLNDDNIPSVAVKVSGDTKKSSTRNSRFQSKRS